MTLLELDHVRTGYGETVVIPDLSLTIEEEESVTVLGPNGAGKTTLLRSIMGQIPVREGSITYNGVDITSMSTSRRVSRGIVLTPEERDLFSEMTVRENLLMGGTSISESKAIARFEEVFDIFPILEERQDQVAGSMSGGQQQMLAIARSLIPDPDVLLMDEPTLGLAPQLVDEVRDKLQHIQDNQDITILLVEQNAGFAMSLASHAHILTNGEIVSSGTPEEIIESDEIEDIYLGR